MQQVSTQDISSDALASRWRGLYHSNKLGPSKCSSVRNVGDNTTRILQGSTQFMTARSGRHSRYVLQPGFDPLPMEDRGHRNRIEKTRRLSFLVGSAHLEDVLEALQCNGNDLGVVHLQQVRQGRDAALRHQVLDLLRLAAAGRVRNCPRSFLKQGRDGRGGEGRRVRERVRNQS